VGRPETFFQYLQINNLRRLRPDRFAAAAAASVVAAHSCLDASIFSNTNVFDVAAAVAASHCTRPIVVLQHDHADSMGDIFAYSEKYLGHLPLVLPSLPQPSPALISEFARALRVGGWVVMQTLEGAIFHHVQWLVDLIKRGSDMQVDSSSSVATPLEDSRRYITHSQFRLWIISPAASAVPPKLLQSAHIIVHESVAQSFAATAATAVRTAAEIRDEICPKCTLNQRSNVTLIALLHALFSFKTACSASLSLGYYDTHPSLPALRIQIANLFAFLRSTTGLNPQINRGVLSQQGSFRTPNFQSNSPAPTVNVVSSATSATGGSEQEDARLLQVLCGGGGLFMGCCNEDERKRLTSLAEHIYISSSSAGLTSKSIAIALSLPATLVLTAEAGDAAGVAECLPFADADCPALGPDVQRVHALQQSCDVMIDLVTLSATSLEACAMSRLQVDFLHRERTERCMAWIERGAPCRPNGEQDFSGHAVELRGDLQLDIEVATKGKNAPVTGQSGTIGVETKAKLIKSTHINDFMTTPRYGSVYDFRQPIANPKRPLVNSVLLTLYEIMIELPQEIGSVIFVLACICFGLTFIFRFVVDCRRP
jgi:hypothetical protein